MADVKTAVRELAEKYLPQLSVSSKGLSGEKADNQSYKSSLLMETKADFNQAERDYWWQYGITEQLLELAQVVALDKYA
jgi:hypothetical protein